MKLGTKEIETDVLVVGGGGAGAMAAIKAMEEGVKVMVATKGPYPSGNSSIALAGYAAATGHSDKRDNPDVHLKDVVRAGNGLNNQRVVRAWVTKIVELTEEMDKWGIKLIKENGEFAQRPWAEHTYARMVHQNLTTGKAVTQCLREKSREIGVEAFEDTLIAGLLKDGDRIAGAWGFDYKTGKLLVFRAKAVVMASGGLGHLYPIYDNFKTITGEGYSTAFRAGAELVDIEMMHFLPTVCFPGGEQVARVAQYFLRDLLELLSEGARLYNAKGERFMYKQYPDSGEKNKTGKQIVQAVGLEVCEGRGTPQSTVYLDLSDIPKARLKQAFAKVWNKIENTGIDLRCQPLEIGTYAHDSLGGVRINEKGETSIAGLFAAGEAAGGSHGAARIGGSALADALAFGAIAAKSASDYARRVKEQPAVDKNEIRKVQRRLDALLSKKKGVEPSVLKKELQGLSQRYLNTVRNEAGLKTIITEMDRLQRQMLSQLTAKGRNKKECATRLRQVLELDGQLELAKLIATAGLLRQESRGGSFGGHYRSDYPTQNDKKWLRNIILKSDKGKITYRTAKPVMEKK